MVIYADILFLINLAVNYALIILTTKICDDCISRLRACLGAALGALYAVLCVIYPDATLWVFKLAVGAVMVTISFGLKKTILKNALVFLSCASAFGGGVYACSIISGKTAYGFVQPVTLRILFFCFCLCYVVIGLVFRRSAKHIGGTVKAEIEYKGRKITLHALIDTGNSLKDPLTGKSAIIIGQHEAAQLLGTQYRAALLTMQQGNEAETVTTLAAMGLHLRLIPFVTVAGSGIMVAFTPDKIVIDGREKTGMVAAITTHAISDGGAYSALIGTQEVK